MNPRHEEEDQRCRLAVQAGRSSSAGGDNHGWEVLRAGLDVFLADAMFDFLRLGVVASVSRVLADRDHSSESLTGFVH